MPKRVHQHLFSFSFDPPGHSLLCLLSSLHIFSMFTHSFLSSKANSFSLFPLTQSLILFIRPSSSLLFIFFLHLSSATPRSFPFHHFLPCLLFSFIFYSFLFLSHSFFFILPAYLHSYTSHSILLHPLFQPLSLFPA